MSKGKYKLLFETISDLSYSNRSIGLWDNQRYNECKKKLKDINANFLYTSEKNTRKYLELRAKSKNRIDKILYK